ncbi:MAG: hypothetical protein KAX44_03895 [Candidatus Brocadiae bacterium]|nr:hypothetical protein [Candidatus Brocadiia bacterium]
MQRVKEAAQRLSADMAEQRRRLAEREGEIDAASSVLAGLERELRKGPYPADGPVMRLVGQLKRHIWEMRDGAFGEWARRLRKWEETLDRLGNQADRMANLATLGELSGSIAHEIRNPLCGMLLSAEVLETKMDPDDSRMTVLQNLRREAERMEKVVNNLLHFARHYRPRLVPCDLEEAILGTVDSIRAHLQKKRIVVDVACASPCREADMDLELMQQVFRNILLNSVDACPEGSRLSVEVRVLDELGQVAVIFHDEGPGIQKDVLGRVFDPFFSSKHNGVGLGLSVSQKIVEAHQGRLEVASGPGEGATFTVIFPARAESRSERVAA